uniref:Laminin EGF-like domain-containing protein n=1 Tax=Pundamilia nyererei TaxID=303518 RepID=A0A3B4HCL0_9CICH
TPTMWKSACFYGNPVVLGSRCQTCDCSGNSDPNMLFTDCHPLTGHCLSCMHNTAGPRCESCFGVPRSRDQCDCSPCGTESCDPHSGQCRCKPGVTGPLCDRCEVRALSEVTSPQHLSFKHGRHVGSGLEPY